LLTDGSATTQPVSGTVTANPASGTIDTVTTVSTVSAVTSLDPIVHVDDAAYTLGTDSGVMMMGFAGTQSVNANDAGAIAMETDGAVHIHDGGNSITIDGTVAVTGVATAAAQLPDGHNVTVDNASIVVTATNLDCQSGGADMATAAGQLADGHNVTVDNSTGGAAVNIQDGGNSITIDGTVTANLGATDNAVLDDIAAKLAPHTTNGHSFYLNQDTNAVASVKASAGTIYWISCQSIDATPVYLNLYNVASGSVTLGTTTPSMQFIVPSQGDALGSGLVLNFGPLGIQFGTAITVAAATTYNGSTDPGANVVITNIGYE